MNRIDSLFISLLLAWAVWVAQEGGGSVFTPREPLISGGGEKVMVIADIEDRKQMASVLLSQTWRELLDSQDLVITDTEDEPDEDNFAAAWRLLKGEAPLVVIEGPKGGEKVPFDKSLTAESLREKCLAKGIE